MRLRLLLTIFSVLALVLTACGGDEETASTASPTPGDVTTDASPTPGDTAPDADADGDADVDADTTTPEAAEPIVQAVDATIAEGSATFDATVDIDTPDLTDTVTSNGVVDFDGDQRQLDVAAEDVTVSSIARSDGLLLTFDEEIGWVRVDPRQLQGTPLEAYGVASLPLQDPSVNLQLLRGTTEDVQSHGDTDLDGETVQHYEVTVDIERAAAQADPEARDAVAAIGEQTGSTTIDMEVWIDDQDRIRRIFHSVDLSEAEVFTQDTAPEGTIDITLDLYDFGQPVEIAEPAEGEIVDVDEQTLEELIRRVTAGQ
jgi:hypothetical protein